MGGIIAAEHDTAQLRSSSLWVSGDSAIPRLAVVCSFCVRSAVYSIVLLNTASTASPLHSLLLGQFFAGLNVSCPYAHNEEAARTARRAEPYFSFPCYELDIGRRRG